jgi:hypothetical protein
LLPTARVLGNRASFIERLKPACYVAAETKHFVHGLNTLLDMCSLNIEIDGKAEAA